MLLSPLKNTSGGNRFSGLEHITYEPTVRWMANNMDAATRARAFTGNPNVASTSTDNTVIFNNAAPTVAINQAATQTDPTNSSAIGFTVIFSAPMTGFTGTDVTLTGSTATGTLLATVTGSGANYTVTVTGMTAPGTVVATIPAGAAS